MVKFLVGQRIAVARPAVKPAPRPRERSAYWRETLKQEDTQQRLAANIYRSVTLEHSPPE